MAEKQLLLFISFVSREILEHRRAASLPKNREKDLLCFLCAQPLCLSCGYIALDLVAVLFTLVRGGKELRLLWGQGQGHQCVDVSCLSSGSVWVQSLPTACVSLRDYC